MKIGRTLGLQCGHHTEVEEFLVDRINQTFEAQSVNYNCVDMLDSLEFYCNVHKQAFKAKRINLFVIEREPKLIV